MTGSLRTLAETAKLLNISIPTAKRWIYAQKLVAHRIGGRWMVADNEIKKFFTYRIVREMPILFANAPLKEEEAARITDVLAAALRQAGAPVRSDGLLDVVRDQEVPGPIFWRYLYRVLTARPPDHASGQPIDGEKFIREMREWSARFPNYNPSDAANSADTKIPIRKKRQQ